jgi:hypothetical protein
VAAATWSTVRQAINSPVAYSLVMAAYVPAMLFADAAGPRWVQTVVGVVTWAVLAVVWVAVERRERRQLVAVVVIATATEVMCSIVWGLYIYRFENLPLYVPPGHGLIYLLAVRLAALLLFGRKETPRVIAAIAVAWSSAGLVVLGDHPDVAGALLLPILLWCLLTRARARVYAGAFVATASLEIIGTQFGNWQWQEWVPGTWVQMGNPPSAIAAGYCLLDATVLAVCGWRARQHVVDSPGRIGRAAARNSTPLSVQRSLMPAFANASPIAAASEPETVVQPSFAGGSPAASGQG